MVNKIQGDDEIEYFERLGKNAGIFIELVYSKAVFISSLVRTNYKDGSASIAKNRLVKTIVFDRVYRSYFGETFDKKLFKFIVAPIT